MTLEYKIFHDKSEHKCNVRISILAILSVYQLTLQYKMSILQITGYKVPGKCNQILNQFLNYWISKSKKSCITILLKGRLQYRGKYIMVKQNGGSEAHGDMTEQVL